MKEKREEREREEDNQKGENDEERRNKEEKKWNWGDEKKLERRGRRGWIRRRGWG